MGFRRKSSDIYESVSYRTAAQLIRPNKKISVFLVMGLKILGRVGTHFFNYCFILEKILCILKGISPFEMHKLYFSPKT